MGIGLDCIVYALVERFSGRWPKNNTAVVVTAAAILARVVPG